MPNNKNKKKDDRNSNDSAVYNDQLGENAGEGRAIKAKSGKKRK